MTHHSQQPMACNQPCLAVFLHDPDGSTRNIVHQGVLSTIMTDFMNPTMAPESPCRTQVCNKFYIDFNMFYHHREFYYCFANCESGALMNRLPVLMKLIGQKDFATISWKLHGKIISAELSVNYMKLLILMYFKFIEIADICHKMGVP